MLAAVPGILVAVVGMLVDMLVAVVGMLVDMPAVLGRPERLITQHLHFVVLLLDLLLFHQVQHYVWLVQQPFFCIHLVHFLIAALLHYYLLLIA